MKKALIIAVGGAAVALGVAAPANAQPGMDFSCAPCINVPVVDPDTGETVQTPTPIWNAFFDGTNGVFGDGEGAWETGVKSANGGLQEGLADATDGTPGDGQGAWEKAFPAG